MRESERDNLRSAVRNAIIAAVPEIEVNEDYYIRSPKYIFEVATNGPSWKMNEHIRVTGDMRAYRNGRERKPYFLVKSASEVPEKLTKMLKALDALIEVTLQRDERSKASSAKRGEEFSSLFSALAKEGYSPESVYGHTLKIATRAGEVRITNDPGYWKITVADKGCNTEAEVLTFLHSLRG